LPLYLTARHHLCLLLVFFLSIPLPQRSTLFPYTTLFRSSGYLSNLFNVITSPNVQPNSQSNADYDWINDHFIYYNAGSITRVNRSEEHTSELQSRENLVCRLLLEKKEAAQPRRR